MNKYVIKYNRITVNLDDGDKLIFRSPTFEELKALQNLQSHDETEAKNTDPNWKEINKIFFSCFDSHNFEDDGKALSNKDVWDMLQDNGPLYLSVFSEFMSQATFRLNMQSVKAKNTI